MGCSSSKTIGADEDFTVTLEGTLDGQGGGHGRIQKCLIQPGDVHGVAKPVDHREGLAYALLKKTALADFIPKFYGNHKIDGTEYLVISDLSGGFKSPCVADLKVGTRHYDLQATEQKITELTNKAENSTTPTLGVRVIDVTTRKDGAVTYNCDKKQGLKNSSDDFREVMKKFLPSEHLQASFYSQLTKLIQAYEASLKKFPGLRIYASSVLVCYDGDADPDKAELRLALIDFAHMYIDISKEGVKPDKSYDDGVVYGLKRLRSLVPQAPKYKLVLLRHGESQWNLENRFTGWYDCDLSEKGVQEAHDAGKTLKAEGFTFTLAYTSVLTRANNTFKTCDSELSKQTPKQIKDWHLNERMYGGLTGLNKKETVDQYGEEKVNEWRRSYDIPPPECADDSPYNPKNNELYKDIDPKLLPKTESLKDTVARVLPYWESTIKKSIQSGEKVIIVAHGNSLRALVMYLDGMTKDAIAKLNIPTAVPLLYELDENCFPISHRYLGDQELINAKINAVKNQTKGNPAPQ